MPTTPVSPTFYRESSSKVLDALQTRLTGLNNREAQDRLRRYGPNTLTAKHTISAFRILLRQFNNSLTLILLVAALLILFIYFFGEKDQTDLIEAFLIIVITCMTVILGFVQEFKAEKAVESLRKMMALTTRVRRDNETSGRSQEIDIAVSDLVPGDIVLLSEGMKVPADIRLLEVYSLQTNESSLTGESVPVSKHAEPIKEEKQIGDQTNMVFAGTVIVRGRSIGVVTKTGNATEIGKIAQTVSEVVDEQTPLQKKLTDIGRRIGILVIVTCILVFLFIGFFSQEFSDLPFFEKILHSFIASVALAVAAIPEGLPAVVTISLALGTKRMVKKNALVKRLSAVEALGSADVICTDKTGTLTKGEMTVTELYSHKKFYTLSGSGYEKTGEFKHDGSTIDPSELERILETGLECNNASLEKGETIQGDPTEAALLVSAAKAHQIKNGERVFEIPFSSERKMMSVVVKRGSLYLLFAKGATEVILKQSSSLDILNKKQKITLQDTKDILSAQQHLTSKALRVLAFAYRELTEEEYLKAKSDEKMLEKDLVFLGLQGMMDPPRDEVKSLISSCHESGIRVIMITGDHSQTAKAIAEMIAIPGDVVTGEELAGMTEEKLLETVRTINIYARINPEDKMKIVSALQKDRHIVAMTGDGVNDAPALKKADIGVAMGITGTDVAKESADVILLDDKFGTIVSAIEEGRAIYQNIKKFVHYLLTCNMAEVLIIVCGVFFLNDILLTATMLLWVNVVTDGLPAIALGLDPASEKILRSKPQAFQKDMLEKKTWIELFLVAIFIATLLITLYILTLPSGTLQAQSTAFMALVLFEFVSLYQTRQKYKIKLFSNRWLLLASGTTLLLQLSIFLIPFFQTIFQVTLLSFSQWSLIIICAAILWIFLSVKERILNTYFMKNS